MCSLGNSPYHRLFVGALILVALQTPGHQQQVRIDICAMSTTGLTDFLTCALESAPEGTKQKWDKLKALFKGRAPEEAIGKACQSAPTTGIAIINGFINQQSKVDKPKLKQLLLECYEQIS
ncbi:uncharacterized protein LOC111264049 [Varroa jacobsoni]|uniref:Uncharacterized protein n=1 Tax=Varroa destructor TaxID=109461 RepID=A0A7M7IYP4_VARDE|nr:uncharacterized protein LOC111242795 [Varroa destructor]XP_022643347.1 uncharacterized protein LOC111242795 [Varroa destructor]XP_022643348.1 uncharacterized protein LOC111242795 [Varroa destructor]XP_022643349.1 uncharacterized protein LOC111242795 [Varroa destructor]XP_022695369.1 uncharacterized protein LOC111264049 [Varroa jacobsoni]